MRELVWLLIGISILSCRSQDQHRIHISQIESNIKIDESGNEIFNSYYSYFVEDSIFQKYRTIIPESVTSPEYIDPEGRIRDTVWAVDTEKWKFISIKSTSEIGIKGDTAYIVGELFTHGSLHSFGSQFCIMNGKWYLDLTSSPNKGILMCLLRYF